MRRRATLLGIVLASCGGGGDASPDAATDGGSEPAELAGITQRHNDVRAMVSAGDPLPQLVWSGKLATLAAGWVTQCRDQQVPTGLVDHNPDRSVGQGYYVGENVFGKGGPPDITTPELAVMQWAAEVANYDYANNTCPGGTCGHYTQIVWRATREIGCAVADCPSLQYRASIVCNYGPGGNITGQRPY